jgi:predicted nucleotidyltransferase
VDQNYKSLNGELLHEDEEKADVNKRRAVSKKKSIDTNDRVVSVKSSSRSLRPKSTISYEEEPLKTPPAKRKCNSSKLDIPPRVASYLEKLFQGNKFLKDKQIMEISKETDQTETQIREWFKERSLRSSLDESQSECSRGRRRVSRYAF